MKLIYSLILLLTLSAALQGSSIPEERTIATLLRTSEIVPVNRIIRARWSLESIELAREINRINRLYSLALDDKSHFALNSYQMGLIFQLAARKQVELIQLNNRKIRCAIWEACDLKKKQRDMISKIIREGHIKSLEHYDRALKLVKKLIKSDPGKTHDYLLLQSAVRRKWIVAHYELGSRVWILPVLKKYLSNSINEDEYPAHVFIALAYTSRLKMMTGGNPRSYKLAKKTRALIKKHFLRAAELKYGSASRQYKKLSRLFSSFIFLNLR